VLELELRNLLLQVLHVGLDAEQGGIVVLRLRHAEQLARIGEAAGDALQRGDGGFEGLLLAPELLGALLVGPDRGVFEVLVDRYEALLLALEVKNTSSAPQTVCSDLRAWRRWR
jgi:hypothetical protein